MAAELVAHPQRSLQVDRHAGLPGCPARCAPASRPMHPPRTSRGRAPTAVRQQPEHAMEAPIAGGSGQLASTTSRMSRPAAIGSTLRTRPTAEMMPVNIQAALRLNSVSMSSPMARLSGAHEARHAGQVGHAESLGGGPAIAADDARSMEPGNPVHQPIPQQPGRDLGAALDQHPGQPGLAQRGEPAGQVHATLAARHREQPHAGIGERLPPLGRHAVTVQHPGRVRAGRGDQPGCQPGAQMAVHDDTNDRAVAVAGDAAGQQRDCRPRPCPRRRARRRAGRAGHAPSRVRLGR